MGLLVDIRKEHNATMSDLKDVYLRIERLVVFPKAGAIRATIAGYINPESGYVMKQKDIAEVKVAEEFFFTNEVLEGSVAESMYHNAPEDETIDFYPRVVQTSGEPAQIFRDYYSLFMYDSEGNIKPEYKELKIWDVSGIHKLFYKKIKAFETRFENIRDVLVDPEIN